MSMLRQLAEFLGVGERDVERALKDEQRARSALSRRALLLGSAAVAAQAVLPLPPVGTIDLDMNGRVYSFVWNNPLATIPWSPSVSWVMQSGLLLPYLITQFREAP